MVVEFEPQSEHILRGAAATLEVTFYADGVVADPGVTTVSVTRLDGTAIVTGAATSGAGAAARTYALGAEHTAELDVLTVAWDSATYGTVEQTIEIVGAFLFTLREARAWDSGTLANTATYPAMAIEDARQAITDEFERVAGVSFIPRIRQATVDGDGTSGLFLPDIRVRAIRRVETLDPATLAWAAYTADELATVALAGVGRISLSAGTFPAGRANVRVTYETGYDAPPAPVRDAALAYLRYRLVGANLQSRAISATNDYGSEQYWTPGLSGRGTAMNPLPHVDMVLRQYGARRPVIA